MTAQGPRLPQTAASTIGNAPETRAAWVTPDNALSSSDGGAEAQVTAANYDAGYTSYLLVLSNFGFSIPTGDTILGVTVVINRRYFAGGPAVDYRVQLRDASGTLFGSNLADTGTNWPNGTLGTATYGGSSNMWGLNSSTLTPTIINDPDFGLVISATANGANTDIGVDYATITVEYTHNATQYQQAFATPALSFTGGIAKQASRALTAALTFSGAVVKETRRALSGGLDFTGSVSRGVSRSVGADVTFSTAFGTDYIPGAVTTPALTIIHYHTE